MEVDFVSGTDKPSLDDFFAGSWAAPFDEE
jgi:hypothetical protein